MSAPTGNRENRGGNRENRGGRQRTGGGCQENPGGRQENPGGRQGNSGGRQENPGGRGRHNLVFLGALGMYLVMVGVLRWLDNPLGTEAITSLVSFTAPMMVILPSAFVLIGLFEVWVPREVVERHVGRESGVLAYGWAVLLAGTTIGGIYVSFPVACALRHKGAGMGFILAYISLSGVSRIPMTLFELSTVGPAFTVIRYAVAVPLVIGVSYVWGRRLERRFASAGGDEPGDPFAQFGNK